MSDLEIVRALWTLRFQPNLDEIVTDAFVRGMPRRHRRNPARRREVEEVAKLLAEAIGKYTKPDDTFEEFTDVFLAGLQYGRGELTDA